MQRIRIYTTRWCGYCRRAKALLEAHGLRYEEVALDDDPAFRETLARLTGRRTLPQVVVDGVPVGGYAELEALERAGRLDELRAA